MYSNDIGKISSRTTKNKLVELSRSREIAPEKRINALNLLSRKKDLDPSELFSAVLKDKKETVPIKSTMVLRLGAQLKKVSVLEKFLGKVEGPVTRSILHVLAYKGDAGSYKKIDALLKDAKQDKLITQKAQFAKTMISYRLGDNNVVLSSSEAEQMESFRRIKAEPIEKQKLSVVKATKILNDLQQEHVAVPLATTKAQKLICQGKELALLFNEQLVEHTYNFDTNGILAAITEDDYCPGGHFVRYHVLANKEAGSGYRIHILNTNGRLIMEGTGTKKGETFAFEVKAVKRPGSTPIFFKADFNSQKNELDVKEAKSGAMLRKSSQIVLKPDGKSNPSGS
ncbi:hypothetical protein [Altibacter sp.]|uniref:hypothetical protein n=1 Tax=Altibacter sp. TaxID=2024823 RepID=UPI000C8E8659|nr:hypothetical protein [Altibacter sp.]MAP53395.1 hypothetical protein [Altibacter sp.]